MRQLVERQLVEIDFTGRSTKGINPLPDDTIGKVIKKCDWFSIRVLRTLGLTFYVDLHRYIKRIEDPDKIALALRSMEDLLSECRNTTPEKVSASVIAAAKIIKELKRSTDIRYQIGSLSANYPNLVIAAQNMYGLPVGKLNEGLKRLMKELGKDRFLGMMTQAENGLTTGIPEVEDDAYFFLETIVKVCNK